jgi:hypothetical protein
MDIIMIQNYSNKKGEGVYGTTMEPPLHISREGNSSDLNAEQMFRSMISEDTQVFRFTYFYVGWKPGNSGF